MVIEYIKAIIFGLVQGATEFIPVSSSGHLVLLHQWLDAPYANTLAFDAFLHLGTLGAVLWFYWLDLVKIFKIETKSIIKGRFKDSLLFVLLVATIPAAIMGYLFESKAETVFRSPLVVALMMALVGGLFLWIEKPTKASRTPRVQRPLESSSVKDGLVIGLAQAIALIPGASRSGITIVAGLWRGLSREAAVKFTFLLSIPIITGASILGLLDLVKEGSVGLPWSWLLASFLSAFFSGLLAIKFLVNYLKNNTLRIFAYYRFIIAILILLYTFVF